MCVDRRALLSGRVLRSARDGTLAPTADLGSLLALGCAPAEGRHAGVDAPFGHARAVLDGCASPPLAGRGRAG